MKKPKTFYTISRLYIAFMFVSLMLGLIYLVGDHLNVIIYAFTYDTASFPNVIYWFSRCIGIICIPAIFLIPTPARLERIKVIKYSFIVYGITMILTASWIFAYMSQNGLNGLFSNDIIETYQYSNHFVGIIANWGTFTWAGTIMAIVYGAFCIYTGLNFDDNKRKVCILTIILFVFRTFLPLIVGLFLGDSFYLINWLSYNFAEIASLIAFMVAILIAASHDFSWISLIWGQDVTQTEENV